MQIRDDVALAFGSDRGAQRSENQDDILIYEAADDARFELRGRLVALADGMGGGAAGGEASRIALRAFLCAWLDAPLRRSASEAALDDDREAGLRLAFRAAQDALDAAARRNSRLKGMGTTLTAIVQCATKVFGVHVGDSRCMHVRSGQGVWLSELHANPGDAGQLTRALVAGKANSEHPDSFRCTLEVEDRILLMSDGFWRPIAEGEALATLHSCSPQDAVSTLLARVRAIDGSDNASLVVLEYKGLAESGLSGARELEEVLVQDAGQVLVAERGATFFGRWWSWVLFALGIALGVAALWVRGF